MCTFLGGRFCLLIWQRHASMGSTIYLSISTFHIHSKVAPTAQYWLGWALTQAGVALNAICIACVRVSIKHFECAACVWRVQPVFSMETPNERTHCGWNITCTLYASFAYCNSPGGWRTLFFSFYWRFVLIEFECTKKYWCSWVLCAAGVWGEGDGGVDWAHMGRPILCWVCALCIRITSHSHIRCEPIFCNIT